MKYLLLALLITSCGMDENTTLPAISIDPELGVLLDEYIEESTKRGNPPSQDAIYKLRALKYSDEAFEERNIVFNSIGICIPRHLNDDHAVKWNEVFIRPKHDWPAVATNQLLKAIVFHELGHALHDFKHEDFEYGDLMAEVLPIDMNNWDSLLNNMFNREKK